MKEIFKIILSVAIFGLVSFAFLEPLFTELVRIFNTYLDGLFQFIQQFAGLGNCTILVISLSIFIVFILINIFFGS